MAVWVGEGRANPSSVPPPPSRTDDEIESLCWSSVSEPNEPNHTKVIDLQHCLEHLRAHDAHVRELKRRLDRQPQDAELWIELAKAGEVIESVVFRQAMKVDLHEFTMAKYWNALGIGWSSLGKIPESLIAFRECLRLQPLSPAAWDCVAIGLLELPGEDAGAFAAIRAVIAIQGAENISWLRDKADVLRGRGHLSVAAEIERLLELDGMDPP